MEPIPYLGRLTATREEEMFTLKEVHILRAMVESEIYSINNKGDKILSRYKRTLLEMMEKLNDMKDRIEASFRIGE